MADEPTVQVIKRSIESLMPTGEAWKFRADGVEQAIATAFARRICATIDRVQDMLREIPSTATETIEEWEKILGLPEASDDPTELLDIGARRAAVAAKFGESGLQAVQHMIDEAARLGFAITIEQCVPFQVGLSAVGDPLNGASYGLVFIVHAPLTSFRYFRVGESSVGDPLRSWGNSRLESLINRMKYGHTIALFSYA